MTEQKDYTRAEERLNIVVHVVGLAIAVVASVFLLRRAADDGSLLNIFSFGVFGISLIVLYSASVAYHSAKKPRLRSRLRIFDHAAIYFLIAGTYTPFTLITVGGSTGLTLFIVVWAMAVIGTVLKLFFTGRFDRTSTLVYVIMGWIIVFAIEPLVSNLATAGLVWLIAGGMAYTIGAILYAVKTMKYNHAIFHVFVVVGSVCHIVAAINYIQPAI